MNYYKDIYIYNCKFFKVNKNEEIEFTMGEFKGKVSKDFKTIKELQRSITYCFWILTKEDNPLETKYLASVFLKELSEKIVLLESRLHERTLTYQTNLEKKTEKSINIVGKKYGK